jgi:hypothetical protein
VFLAVAVAALGGFYLVYVQGAQDTIATQQKKLDGMLAEAAKARRHGAAAQGISVAGGGVERAARQPARGAAGGKGRG